MVLHSHWQSGGQQLGGLRSDCTTRHLMHIPLPLCSPSVISSGRGHSRLCAPRPDLGLLGASAPRPPPLYIFTDGGISSFLSTTFPPLSRPTVISWALRVLCFSLGLAATFFRQMGSTRFHLCISGFLALVDHVSLSCVALTVFPSPRRNAASPSARMQPKVLPPLPRRT
jgi:hypothetical protein